MSTQTVDRVAPRKHQPYVPETMEMKEFTFRAVLLGMLMTGILGAANAYLGLRAGFISPGPHRGTSVRNAASKRNACACKTSTGGWEDVRSHAWAAGQAW